MDTEASPLQRTPWPVVTTATLWSRLLHPTQNLALHSKIHAHLNKYCKTGLICGLHYKLTVMNSNSVNYNNLKIKQAL